MGFGRFSGWRVSGVLLTVLLLREDIGPEALRSIHVIFSTCVVHLWEQGVGDIHYQRQLPGFGTYL